MVNLPRCSQKVAHFAQDVWSVFSPLAVKTGAVNLGQGFPNFPPPDFIKQAAIQSVQNDANNQYAHPRGNLSLRNEIVTTFSPLFHRDLDPDTNIMVSSGANHAIYATLAAYLNEGDETILLEPFFDQYEPNITMNGGVPVYVPLRLNKSNNSTVDHASNWILDLNELRASITPRTKVIILNTPHNPIGKVFSQSELLAIGQIAKEFNLLIIADEVYERLIYSPSTSPHVRIATLSEDLWNRTVTIGSAGKTFAVTGWRLGWVIGTSELIEPILNAHTRTVFCANGPLQLAVANALQQAREHDYYSIQVKEYLQRRDKLIHCFNELGLRVTIPDGSYFILVDTSNIKVPTSQWEQICHIPMPSANKDWRMCYWLTTHIGVAAIPPSSFYSPDHSHLAENLARFCFCKTDDTLNKAITNLQKLRPYIIR